MPRHLTTIQAAARLRVHPKTLARYVREGRVVPVVPGRKGRGGAAMFSRAALDRLHARRPAPELGASRVQEIEAALQEAGNPPEWLERLSDDWLARVEECDPARVKASRERDPHVRERDFNDHRIGHHPDSERATIFPLEWVKEHRDRSDEH